MKKLGFFACLTMILMLFSCAAMPEIVETGLGDTETSSGVGAGDGQQEVFASAVPVRPSVPERIMGRGLISPEHMSAFLIGTNPEADMAFVEKLVFLYAEEASIEGVNHDAAFAQMCLETGFLGFGGLVTPDQFNFCGLGAIGPGQPGHHFPNPRTGVRAHIQHLKAYATDEPPKRDLVDPRYKYVRLGSAPVIQGLAGTWAADLLYAEKINNILERLYNFSFND